MELRSVLGIHLLALTLGAALPASAGNGSHSDGVAESGTIKLALQSTPAGGKVYRLRNARFAITGPTTTTLATPAPAVNDSDLSLRATLISGNYSILLQPGWKLWRIASDGSEGIVDAQLVSVNPVEFQVTNGNETTVVFSFRAVDDGTVSFGSGSALVMIDVTEGTGGGGCVPTPGPDLPDDSFTDSNCDGIDGDASQALFVAIDGQDTNPGTSGSPLQTVQAALARALPSGKNQVYVSAGIYSAPVVLMNGVSIYGGYSRAAGWARSATNIATLENGGVSEAGNDVIAVRGTDISSSTVLDRLTIRAGSMTGPAAPSRSFYGLHCTRCTGVALKNSVVVAGAGGDGTLGADGARGGDGGPGLLGGRGQPDGTTPGQGGAEGSPACGRAGGRGGNGGGRAGAGQNGHLGVGGTLGGVGGAAGSPGAKGADGSTGAFGTSGRNGTGAPAGVIDSGFWVTSSGAPAAPGNPGNGGGGGGGGGGQRCGLFCIEGTGNGGGGGGAGGCPGMPGSAGGGAGGSFGLVLVDSTGFQLLANRIESGAGGTGGRGGTGGSGGQGGPGGAGGTVDPTQVGDGGQGGNGGPGGSGGHGGGGAGGSSFAVVLIRSTVATAGNSLLPGAPGLGGPTAGIHGAPGSSAAVLAR